MANIKSAKKQVRKIKRRSSINNYWKTSVRTSLKSFQKAIDKNDKTSIIDLLKHSKSLLDKAAQRNVMHKNKASRIKSNMERAALKIK